MKKIAFLFAMGIVLQAGAQEIKLPNEREMEPKTLEQALMERQTNRSFSSERLEETTLSAVLWAANGVNRPESGKRTAPSARNVQETEIYVFMEEGVFLYDPFANLLSMVVDGDHRAEISSQPHFAKAPVALVLVANYDKMQDFKTEDRDFYAAVDCGYVSQNIYLACAACNLGTVACGAINRDKIASLLKIKNGKPMLAHPVGFVK